MLNRAERDLRFHLRDIFGEELSLGVDFLGEFATKEQTLLDALDEQQPHNLTHVHPRDHLLIAASSIAGRE